MKNTKIIAEFMGYPTRRYWWHHPSQKIDNGLPISINAEISEFKTNWNWLMAVIDKIETIEDNRFSFQMAADCVLIYDYKQDSETPIISVMNTGFKIKSAYKIVLKFIEWYRNCR